MRNFFVAEALNFEADKRQLTKTEITKRLVALWEKNCTIPRVSVILSGKKAASDKFYFTLWDAIWLTSDSMNKIIKSAEIKAVHSLYWEEISHHMYTNDELIQMICEKNYFDDETCREIKNFIKFKLQK